MCKSISNGWTEGNRLSEFEKYKTEYNHIEISLRYGQF